MRGFLPVVGSALVLLLAAVIASAIPALRAARELRFDPDDFRDERPR